MEKAKNIFVNALPIILMIALIPFFENDQTLAIIYVAIVAAAFYFKKEKNDLLIFGFGFFVMIISEYFFIFTGVEKFNRYSLLGVMPIWLPLLWGYGFVAIKRGVYILDK
jgi:cell division protein FtsW (lipid II flippase)